MIRSPVFIEIQGWLRLFLISCSSAFCLFFFFFATMHSETMDNKIALKVKLRG
jgi:hypothetical protein